ncbi:MAG TPA: DNA mismatch repair protein MutS [Thermoplasmata archaeon]|jgi:DNA mismatch repair protein MutS|nr:DNA mismatch repair protein MutS [Thermoplasmata archaeon]
MPESSALTPLLEQYEGVKARYPGHLVLFRVGDFYETFGDDARLLSRELDVVLTARSADAQGIRTPMAGVPHHAVETYLGRLVRKGYKVALCDQVEDPRLAKGLVRREVTRVVTPGTVVEDRILGGPDHSFLASLVVPAGKLGAYAAVDITTGEWYHGPADGLGTDGVVSSLAAFQPREVLWSVGAEPEAVPLLAALRREFPSARLEPAPPPAVEGELPTALRGDATLAGEVLEADRRLAAYLRVTQPRLLPHLGLVERGAAGRRLVLDAKTLRHLEINRPMNPDDAKGATLLGTWDETVTAPGRRTLAFWLTNPLADTTAIAARQDAVQALVERGAEVEGVRSRLRTVPDLARIAARVAGRRVRPVELISLRTGLEAAESLGRSLSTGDVPRRLARLAEELAPPPGLLPLLAGALPESAVPLDDEGEVFRLGHAPEVDRWREAERQALRDVAALERSQQESTGIRTLKVGYNQVFGYYIEVTKPHLARVPPHYRRRQTVAQAERFTTDELEDVARRVLEAREGIRTAEAARWEELLDSVERYVPAVHRVSRAVGELDALATFAHLAQARGYVRPTVDDSSDLVIREGRHPVLERLLGETFVPNDLDLEPQTRRMLVLTGPNMSGKSTFMRQVGLLVVLAQAGSFVPAKFARVGLVTQLFTRMGFTDEIGRGKSSFMVEMSEVAEILRAADARSLVLLDEVGRGTSTFDGLAIAWATLQHLHDTTRARCLLATHYHQLTDLVRGLRSAENAHFAVREGADGIVFLHRLVPGATDRSYGVHVARLAGLPPGVLEEAERLLHRLETESSVPATSTVRRRRGPRYTQAVLLTDEGPEHPVVDELRSIDPDRLAPEEAVRKLRELKARVSRPTDAKPGESP